MSRERARRLRVALQVGGEIPDDVMEWLTNGLDGWLWGDVATMDAALELEPLADPRSPAVRELVAARDHEIRRVGALLGGTVSAKAAALERMVAMAATRPDPRIARLIAIPVRRPTTAAGFRKILENSCPN